MLYRTIFIDADDTLFDFYAAEEHALAATLYGVGYDKPLSTYMPAFREINGRAWADYEAGKASSKEIRVRRFVELFQILKIDADPEQISSAYVGHLSESAHLLSGVTDALSELHASLQSLDPAGSMVLLTNGLSSVQHPRIDAAGIRHYFNGIVVSEEVGVQKPDPRIFDAALQAARPPAEPATAIMIGDGLHSDILGAQNAGIDSVWVNVRNKPPDPAIQPTHAVASFKDAVAFLL